MVVQAIACACKVSAPRARLPALVAYECMHVMLVHWCSVAQFCLWCTWWLQEQGLLSSTRPHCRSAAGVVLLAVGAGLPGLASALGHLLADSPVPSPLWLVVQMCSYESSPAVA